MIVAAVAIVVQMAILFAIYKSVNQASARMEGIALRFEERSTPVLTTAHEILTEARPRISEITANLAETTAIVREQAAQISEATGEIVERARLQAVRMDELVSSAVERIAETAEMVQDTVVGPIRRIQSIVQALNAGIGFLRQLRARGRHPAANVGAGAPEDEEMFI